MAFRFPCSHTEMSCRITLSCYRWLNIPRFGQCPTMNQGIRANSSQFPLIKIVYPLIIWAIAAHLGPALGPIATAFTVGAKSWRWAGWEMLWLAAPTFILLFLTLPETSGATILLRRAQRLRKLLGRDDLRSQSEIDQKHMNWRQVAFDALISESPRHQRTEFWILAKL